MDITNVDVVWVNICTKIELLLAGTRQDLPIYVNSIVLKIWRAERTAPEIAFSNFRLLRNSGEDMEVKS